LWNRKSFIARSTAKEARSWGKKLRCASQIVDIKGFIGKREKLLVGWPDEGVSEFIGAGVDSHHAFSQAGFFP
jgi:hypothetical protein